MRFVYGTCETEQERKRREEERTDEREIVKEGEKLKKWKVSEARRNNERKGET